MHKKRGRSFGFYVDAAKRGCATPEKIDMLLHGDVLKNPSFQPPEKEMPDLKTALTTALDTNKKINLNNMLNAWEQDEQKQINGEATMPTFNQPTVPLPNGKGRRVFGVTNNVTRMTFDYIRDNPGCVSRDVCDELVPKGFKACSVTPIISQLIKCGTVSRDLDTRQLRALTSSYRPITAAAQRTRLTKTRNVKEEPKPKRAYTKRQKPQDAGIAALPVQAVQVTAPPVVQEEAPRAPAAIILSRNWSAQGVIDKLSVVQARQLYDALKQIFGG
jgi:hypothetical protein